MGWKFRIDFSDGHSYIDDEVYKTKKEAQAEVDSWYENWSAGADVLELAGEDYDDSEIVDYEIWKV